MTRRAPQHNTAPEIWLYSIQTLSSMRMLSFVAVPVLLWVAHGLTINSREVPPRLDATTTLNATLAQPSCPRIAHLVAANDRNYRQDCISLSNDMVEYGRRMGVMTFSKRSRRTGVTPLPFIRSHGECEMIIDAMYGHENEEDTFPLGSLQLLIQWIISYCGFTATATKAGAHPIPPNNFLSLYISPKNGFHFNSIAGAMDENDTVTTIDDQTA